MVVEGLTGIELRLRQTNIGGLCLERESGLDNGVFGGSESLFWVIVLDCAWPKVFISSRMRRRSCCAARNSGEPREKNTVALLKRVTRSRKNVFVPEE